MDYSITNIPISLSPPLQENAFARCRPPLYIQTPPPVYHSPLLHFCGVPTLIQTSGLAPLRHLLMQLLPITINTPLPPLPTNTTSLIHTSIASRYEIGAEFYCQTYKDRRGRLMGLSALMAFPEDAPLTVGEVNNRVTELGSSRAVSQVLYALQEDCSG
ncbi:hypothetical protein Tco_0411393 [Tanacetum coccineum]